MAAAKSVTVSSKHRSPAEIKAELEQKLHDALWDLLDGGYCALLADGNVNQDATLEKLSDDLAVFAEEHSRITAGIGEHVDATFDTFKGVDMSVDFFVSKVMGGMNVPPAQWGRTEVRVRNYISSQSVDAADGTFSRIVVKRGRGGGIARRCDLVEAVSE